MYEDGNSQIDFVVCSCYHAYMKTVTLTDEAYQRLKDWKEGNNDSFSNVVLRLVPRRGTLADLLESFKQLPPLSDPQVKTMTDAVAWANHWTAVRDPWADDDSQPTQA